MFQTMLQALELQPMLSNIWPWQHHCKLR